MDDLNSDGSPRTRQFGLGQFRRVGAVWAQELAVAFSKCMRANGVTHFSDPAGPRWQRGFNGLMEGPNGSLVVDGITFAGPGAPYCSEGVRGVSAAQRPSFGIVSKPEGSCARQR